MRINKARLDTEEKQILTEAKSMLKAGTDAPSFAAKFFGSEGRLAQRGKTEEERRHIVESALYRWLKEQYECLRRKDVQQFERELPTASGRLTVVVPKSLHVALKSEAASEGVSLSELMRLKLTIPYRQMALLLQRPSRT